MPNKFTPFTNTELLSQSFASDSRQQRRHRARYQALALLWDKYGRVTNRNRMEWPGDMSRRQRRLIVSRSAKRLPLPQTSNDEQSRAAHA